MKPGKEKITLVGAGLVGSLLSIFLAKKGFKVEIFERRPDMRVDDVDGGRSINLAVSTRGLYALKEVGLEKEVLKLAIPMLGRMVHSIDGETNLQAYGRDESEYINSVSRAELNKLLMTAAEQTGSVTIYFKKKVTGINFEKNILEVHDEKTGKDSTPSFSTVIGTDGSASAIRHDMAKLKEVQNTEKYLDYGYKELHIPPGSNGAFQMHKNALHIWPRGTYMLIALPNYDGSYTATLFLPQKGDLSFETLKNSKDILEFFKKDFSDVLPLIPDLKDSFFKNPTGHMVTVKCSPWNHGEKSLLIGDAAHAMVPFFGQGMNCGFEDCTLLNQLIEKHSDWNSIFSQFSKERKTHSDAIADMAVENFIEMRDKVADPRFILEKNVEKILHKNFPQSYVSRYALVTFSRTPYRTAYQAGLIENEILAELCKNIKTPDEVNLSRAEILIREKLSPYLKENKNHGS